MPTAEETTKPKYAKVCETCALGKQYSKLVPKETKNKALQPLEIVYSDLMHMLIVLNGLLFLRTSLNILNNNPHVIMIASTS